MAEDISLLLSSEDPKDQIKGINTALMENAHFHILQIIRLISSQNPEVKKTALISLLKLSENCLLPQAVPLPESVKSAAAKIIQKFDPMIVKRLDQDLRSENSDKMIRAFMLLKYFITRQRAQALLHRFLEHPDKKIRATAVLHLGGVASRATMDHLHGFLEDSDNRVKANAIEVLEELNEKSFINVLQRFGGDENNRVRANALKALFCIGEIDIVNDIKFMLMNPNELMRASGVWLIGEIGKQAANVLGLLKIVKNDNSEIVLRNLNVVLRKIGNTPALSFLDHLRSDNDNIPTREIMESKDLDFFVQHEAGYFLLEAQGVLTVNTVKKAKDTFEEAVKTDKRLVINFSKLKYIDNDGMEYLKKIDLYIKQTSGFMYIFGCNNFITESFRLSKLYLQLNVFNSKREIDNFIGVGLDFL